MNDLRKSWGQQECSPAGRTHGISLCSRVITPTLPKNSHPEQSVIKKKPGEGLSLLSDAEFHVCKHMKPAQGSQSLQTFNKLISLMSVVDVAFLHYLIILHCIEVFPLS